MADPAVWGTLPKAQDDATTIDEAVAAAIAAHNDDPTAHMAAGQSIDVHRTNEIVDHPQGSILADKWTNSELEFTTVFESLSGFVTHGTTGAIWPGFQTNPTGTLYANRGELTMDFESANMVVDMGKEQLFQFAFNTDSGGDAEIYLIYGTGTGSTFKKGFGLQIIGSTATFFVSNSAGTVFNTASFGTFNQLQTYLVRMHYVPADGLVYCFVDGVAVASIAFPSSTWTDYLQIRFISIKPTTNTGVLNVKSLYFRFSQAT